MLRRQQTSITLKCLGQHYIAGFTGFCAVFCRQTNIVWVFLVACLAAGQTLTSEVQLHMVGIG